MVLATFEGNAMHNVTWSEEVPTKYLESEYEIADRPLWWHLAGKQQTATGYGRKLTTSRVLRIKGEKTWRRIYVVCYGNSGSAYVIIKGETFYLPSSF
jgi:hypothetical protein